MAHKRKGPRPVRRPSEKGDDEPKGRRVILAIMIVAAMILVPIALLLSSQQQNETPPEPEFEIVFPRDEGEHNESLEFWKVDFLLKDSLGNHFDFNIDYYIYETGPQERVFTFTDQGNVSGRDFFARVHQGTLSVGYEKLDLSFDSSFGTDTWVGEYTIPYQYSYEGQVLDSGSELYYLDLEMASVKNPLLLGDDGVFTLESGGNTLGTIKGYLITRLDVTGTMRLSGSTYTVNGYAWMEHEWGAWTVQDMEELRLQLGTASEIFLVRFFDTQVGQPIKQLAYYSSPGGQVTEIAADELTLANLRYWVDSRFVPSTERCLPSEWDFDSNLVSTHISLYSSVSDQIEKHWEGSVVISGTIGGISSSGRGFAIMNHPYLSTPTIVRFYNDDSIPSDLYVNISNGISMGNVTAHYQVNGGSWKSVPMALHSGDLWKVHISVVIDDEVIAYVEAYDLAGNKVTSQQLQWTVA